MQRLVVAVICLFTLITVPVWAQGVEPNTTPPPGFSPPDWACYETCVLPTDIVASDFDQDGWLDLAVSCSATGNVWVYRNNVLGPGVFTPPGTAIVGGAALVPPGSFPGALCIEAGHVIGNGPAGSIWANMYDGFPDLIAFGPLPINGPPVLGVVPVAFSGWFQPPPPIPPFPFAGPNPLGTGIINMAGGDFNNDNALDMAFITPAGLWHSNSIRATNTYASAGPLPTTGGAPVAVVTADFNQDGWEDIAVLSTGPVLDIFFNNAAGAFATPPVPVAGVAGFITPTVLDVGDFDADGYPDIVVVGNRAAPPFQGFAQVFLNNLNTAVGVPGFIVGTAMSTWGFRSVFVEVFDADGNGRDDFAVANWGSANYTIFLTDGVRLVRDNRATTVRCLPPASMNPYERLDIEFRLYKIELQCGYFPIALAAGDYDRNGKMDLAIALQSADEELCAQNPSCIEVDFDIACGLGPAGANMPGQVRHSGLTGTAANESTECPACKEEPCEGNTPPGAEIQTESGTKNQ